MYQGEKERKRRKVGVVGGGGRWERGELNCNCASFSPLARFLDGEGGNGMMVFLILPKNVYAKKRGRKYKRKKHVLKKG